LYDLARKHRVQPDALATLHDSLQSELETMSGGTEQLAQIKSALEDTALDWRAHATKLSGLRRKAAAKLGSGSWTPWAN
jgi:DNA repair protein RecN (Recombination protein N)